MFHIFVVKRISPGKETAPPTCAKNSLNIYYINIYMSRLDAMERAFNIPMRVACVLASL